MASLGYDISTIQDLLETGQSQTLERLIKSLSSLDDSSGELLNKIL